MEQRKIKVALTQGDANGIGYELIFKVFSEPEMFELCTPVIYGSPKIAAYHRKALDTEANFSIIGQAGEAEDGRMNLLTAFEEEVKIDLGQPSQEAGHAALMSLDRAVTDFRDHLFDVLVMCPVNNGDITGEGFNFKGQANYLQECFGSEHAVLNILSGNGMRVASVTEDADLKDVPAAITPVALTERLTMLHQSLRRDFGISNPRIAVLALNPREGKEEREVITPVIEQLAERHINAFGPYEASAFFANNWGVEFDAVLAMYHDQGVAPFNALAHEPGVVLTTGLPVVAVQPAIGVGYDAAGKGVSDEAPLRLAIYEAIDVYRHRISYDEPYADPLPKLYHEKRDESEKVRFAIPKKHEPRTYDGTQHKA